MNILRINLLYIMCSGLAPDSRGRPLCGQKLKRSKRSLSLCPGHFFNRKTTIFKKAPLFSIEYHFFQKHTSNTLEHARTFSSAIEPSVFLTYLWSRPNQYDWTINYRSLLPQSDSCRLPWLKRVPKRLLRALHECDADCDRA
jgi:hypothetical protein